MGKSVLKDFSKYVSLNILGMIGLSCYILADTFFIAKALGSTGIAALNFSIPIYSLIHGLGLMIGIGGATRFSILKSQSENKDANVVFTHSMGIGAFGGIIFTLIGLFGSKILAIALGADISTLYLTKIYLTTILCFSPFFIINNVLIAFVRNDNNPNLSMAAMLTGSFTNIALDYIFMFPLGMGMFGAAFATGIAPIVSIGILSIHFVKRKDNPKVIDSLETKDGLKTKDNLKTKDSIEIKDCAKTKDSLKTREGLGFTKSRILWPCILNIFSLGLPAFITEVSSAVVLITFNLVILKLEGNIGVASYGIVANLALVAISIFAGIGQGIQPLISKGYGLKNYGLMRKVLKLAMLTSFAIASIMYLVTFLYSNSIVDIFNSEQNPVIAQFAKAGIRIYFVGFFFAGVNIIMTMYLSAKEHAKNAFIISIARGCVIIVPLVLFLGRVWQMTGVWLAFVLTEVIVTLLTILLTRMKR